MTDRERFLVATLIAVMKGSFCIFNQRYGNTGCTNRGRNNKNIVIEEKRGMIIIHSLGRYKG